jgi:3-hydroxyacyl-CoA dehydrogenase/enoyl-CoA hydratase/3-hydroxybutyryl-CoA epimerase
VTDPAVSVRAQRGIGWIELDVPGKPVNVLTPAVRDELESAIEQLGREDDVRALVLISRKRDSFSTGSDLTTIAALRTRDEAYTFARREQAVIGRLERLGKPVVAAVRGACLGGGLELVLACAYRLASEDPVTTFGLPQVRLGVLPAAGGCQRLPRLIGVRPALDLILTGKTVSAARARRLGIVDEVVHPVVLQRVAEETAARLATDVRGGHPRYSLKRLAMEANPLGRKMLFGAARKQLERKTHGLYPAPDAALQCVEHGLTHGSEAGQDVEATLFAELAIGGASRNLVRLLVGSTALDKESVVEGGPPPHPVTNIGVVGAGFMGSAIAGVAVLEAGVDVRLKDRDHAAVGRGLAAARELLHARQRRHDIDDVRVRRLLALVTGTIGWDGFGRTDAVLEAVYEDVDLKRQLFREIEAHVRDDCLLVSNTSTIPIARIAEAVERPERLLGMHFFAPVDKMPLIEVVVTDQTAPWATTTAAAFGKRLGKTVIVVRDRPGFWANRILAPYLDEAGRLLLEGVAADAVDRAAVQFGFPVGPVALLDDVGLDVAERSARLLHDEFAERLGPPVALTRMLEDGRLGRKNGRGFYQYESGKRREVDQTAYEIIGAAVDPDVPKEDIQARLVFAMLNEAVVALDEGVVRSARDGDIGAVYGIGFPAFRGGPLRYLDELGLSDAVSVLEDLERQYGAAFAPAPQLVTMASAGRTLHPPD